MLVPVQLALSKDDIFAALGQELEREVRWLKGDLTSFGNLIFTFVSRQHSITLERSPWKFDWSIYLWSLYSHWWRKKVGLFPAPKPWRNLWHSTLSAGLFFARWSRLWCWHGLPTNKVCVSKFGSNRYGTELFSDSRGGTALVDGV